MDLLNYPRCQTLGCDNAGRYDSGYCGICDIVYNDGDGEKCSATQTSKTNIPTAECSRSADRPTPTNERAGDLRRDVASPTAKHAQREQDRQHGAGAAGGDSGGAPVSRPIASADRVVELLTQGLKFDDAKLPYHLMPTGTIIAMLRVLAYGGALYGMENWRQGFDWSRLYSAAWRHLTQFWSGEEYDSDSGEPHLAHLLCMAMFLYEHWAQNLGNDDRHKLDQYALVGLDVRDLVERAQEVLRKRKEEQS